MTLVMVVMSLQTAYAAVDCAGLQNKSAAAEALAVRLAEKQKNRLDDHLRTAQAVRFFLMAPRDLVL